MRILGMVDNELVGFFGVGSWVDSASPRPWDFYSGELLSWWKGSKNAPGFSNTMARVVRRPNWNHTGVHKTATAVPQAQRAQAK